MDFNFSRLEINFGNYCIADFNVANPNPSFFLSKDGCVACEAVAVGGSVCVLWGSVGFSAYMSSGTAPSLTLHRRTL